MKAQWILGKVHKGDLHPLERKFAWLSALQMDAWAVGPIVYTQIPMSKLANCLD